MFDNKINEALRAPLDKACVKERQQAGRSLSYIEGWHAIAEANRIFGFDAWDRETVWIECVWQGQRKTRSGEMPAASYVARVRVTVRGPDGPVVREGTGAGSGFGKDVGEAHESAIKEAETDAMKRALMTFGNPFGLALYDKEQRAVADGGDAPKPPAYEECRAAYWSAIGIEAATDDDGWAALNDFSGTDALRALENFRAAVQAVEARSGFKSLHRDHKARLIDLRNQIGKRVKDISNMEAAA